LDYDDAPIEFHVKKQISEMAENLDGVVAQDSSTATAEELKLDVAEHRLSVNLARVSQINKVAANLRDGSIFNGDYLRNKNESDYQRNLFYGNPLDSPLFPLKMEKPKEAEVQRSIPPEYHESEYSQFPIQNPEKKFIVRGNK
jgi:hypothetical protein